MGFFNTITWLDCTIAPLRAILLSTHERKRWLWKKLPYMLSASSLWPCWLLANLLHQRLTKESPLLAVLKKPLKVLRVLEVHILKSKPSKRIFHQASIRMILIALQILTRARILTIQWAWWTKESHWKPSVISLKCQNGLPSKKLKCKSSLVMKPLPLLQKMKRSAS